MKKLQSNYTTPKQSKRLLELGVPKDSADCIAHIVDNSIDLHEDFFLKGDARISVINQRHTYTKVTTLEDNEAWLDEPYPCWSVGRLIELYMKARGLDFMYFRIMSDANMIDSIVRMFVESQNEIDFSKLEE